MSDLSSLQGNGVYLDAIPQRPQGRYAHVVLVRETESFPVFQTDGTLNVVRVRAGLEAGDVISRLIMFKRKQTAPERLTGRELLRRYGVIADGDKERQCEYNSENFCKHCPDCIHYGYAIGDAGAEKSKVLVDSAFSITRYDESHKSFTFNALYEHGTMTQAGQTRTSFGEQDHVVPQVFFPSVVTLRDPTYEGLLYVLGNILRCDRYGAQETRTGRVHNHVVAILFANGEIFSNLRFTQRIYDELKKSDQHTGPLDRDNVLRAAEVAYTDLMNSEPVFREKELVGAEASEAIADVTALLQDDGRTRELLTALDRKTRAYAQTYGARR